MDAQPPLSAPAADVGNVWPLWHRVAFRFMVAFFVFTTLHLAAGVLTLSFENPAVDFLRSKFSWGKTLLFGRTAGLTTALGTFQYFVAAVLMANGVTALWSAMDRKRLHYRREHQWARVYLRYVLGGIMLGYGAIKILPSQFSSPSLVNLMQPFGEFTRMQALWNFMGASTAYTVFSGAVEYGGALLLFWRRTTTLGALLLVASLANVTILNFAYDVPVKFNSVAYLLMALALLVPDARRLLDVFIRNRPVPALRYEPAACPAWPRLALAAKALMLGGLLLRSSYEARQSYALVHSGPPAMYGMYDVARMEHLGLGTMPVSADCAQWNRLALGRYGRAGLQRCRSGRVEYFRFATDTMTRMLTLTDPADSTMMIALRYVSDTGGVIVTTGVVNGDSVRIWLRPLEIDRLPLLQPIR